MRKLMVVVTIMLSIFVFASCSAEEQNPHIGTWIDVFNEDTVIFNEDGSGNLGDYKITGWIQEENKIIAEVETMFLPIKVEFEITDFGGEIVLSETPNGFDYKHFLVKSDNYSETSVNNIKQAMEERSVEWDFFSYTNTKLNNEVKAELEYNDKLVKWTAKVYRIEDGYCTLAVETYNGLPLNGVDVFLSMEELASLNTYDTITVVGFIKMGSISTYLQTAYILENHGQQ